MFVFEETRHATAAVIESLSFAKEDVLTTRNTSFLETQFHDLLESQIARVNTVNKIHARYFNQITCLPLFISIAIEKRDVPRVFVLPCVTDCRPRTVPAESCTQSKVSP